jgi:hypothetical protein
MRNKNYPFVMKKKPKSAETSIKLICGLTQMSLMQLGQLLNVSRSTLFRVVEGTRTLNPDAHEKLEMLLKHAMEIELVLRKSKTNPVEPYVISYLKKQLQEKRYTLLKLQEKHVAMVSKQVKHAQLETYAVQLHNKIAKESSNKNFVRSLRALKAQCNVKREVNDVYKTSLMEASIAGMQSEISTLERIIQNLQKN